MHKNIRHEVVKKNLLFNLNFDAVRVEHLFVQKSGPNQVILPPSQLIKLYIYSKTVTQTRSRTPNHNTVHSLTRRAVKVLVHYA